MGKWCEKSDEKKRFWWEWTSFGQENNVFVRNQTILFIIDSCTRVLHRIELVSVVYVCVCEVRNWLTFMEAEKSHNLPSARRAGDVVTFQTWRLKNQGRHWCKPQSEYKGQRWPQAEDGSPSSISGTNSPFLRHFRLFRPSTERDDAHWPWRGQSAILSL